nr:MAG TPA: hypothetical protein [Caudoviricetes sp.]
MLTTFHKIKKATQRVTVCGKWVPPPPEPYIALLYLCPTG